MTHSLRAILRYMLLEASDSEELYTAMMDRYKRAVKSDPNWKTLWDRLVGIGGKAIIIPKSLRDEYLVALIRNGQGLGGDETLEKKEPHQCHRNTAKLYSQGKLDAIVTGYALSEDGFWRQHTWGVRESEFIETTAKRVYYYGLVLTKKQAELFVKNNIKEGK